MTLSGSGVFFASEAGLEILSAADVINAVAGDHAEIVGVVDIQRIAFIGHDQLKVHLRYSSSLFLSSLFFKIVFLNFVSAVRKLF